MTLKMFNCSMRYQFTRPEMLFSLKKKKKISKFVKYHNAIMGFVIIALFVHIIHGIVV